MRAKPADHRVRRQALFVAALLLAQTACEQGTTTPEATVAQILSFSGDDQEGLPGRTLPLPLAVRVLDAAGEGIPGARVRFTAGPSSGSVQHPISVTGPRGIATTYWTLGNSEIAGQTVRAELLGEAETAVGTPVDFRARRISSDRSDLLLARNTSTGPIRLLAYRAGDYSEDRAFVTAFVDSLAILPFSDPTAYDEVVAFMADRPPVLLAPVAWSSGRDTLRLDFPEPQTINLTLWVVKGPFEERAASIRENLRNAEKIWGRAGMGLRFGEAEVVDATDHPRAAEFHGNAPAPCAVGVQAAIGERERRINVYYVGMLGDYDGYACGSRFILMSERSGHYANLLAHELGHTFGLRHEIFGTENVMNPYPGGDMTEGQIYHAQFGATSSLNTVYQLRPQREQRNCGSAVLNGVSKPYGDCLPTIFNLYE